MSSRAVAAFAKDCANGMGLANCFGAGEFLREGSAGIMGGMPNVRQILRGKG